MTDFPNEIKENMYPDEKIFHTIVKKGSLEAKPKWLIVSNRRVIYFDQKMLGRYDLADIPYEKLEHVYFKQGAITSEFSMKDESGLKLILNWLDKSECRDAMEKIKDAINNVAIEPVSIQKKKKLMGREEWYLHKPPESVVRSVQSGPISTPSSQVQSSESDDPLDKLKKLKELHESGIITDKEFEEKRNKLMKLI